MITLLKSKLHQARVTDANREYEGSIGISRELCEAVGLRPWEKVLVANIENGTRLETYVIQLDPPQQVIVNGAAAHAFSSGDRVIIMSFAQLSEEDAARHMPRVAVLNAHNEVAELRLPLAPPHLRVA